MYSTELTQHVRAPRAAVYRALTDPDAVARWRVPDGMHAVVHEFDARVGGSFRVSLVYDAPGARGKSSSLTDTYAGVFVERDGGTDVHLVHDGVPDAIPAADNEAGRRMALANLAALVESAGC